MLGREREVEGHEGGGKSEEGQVGRGNTERSQVHGGKITGSHRAKIPVLIFLGSFPVWHTDPHITLLL